MLFKPFLTDNLMSQLVGKVNLILWWLFVIIHEMLLTIYCDLIALNWVQYLVSLPGIVSSGGIMFSPILVVKM